MAIIPQKQLFEWGEIQKLGELKRLKLVLENLPDEELMKKLERERANGRDDYSVRGVWNSILAGIVFQHSSVEQLRRELMRNGQLRYICGLNETPTSSAYSRFLGRLLANKDMVLAMMNELVAELKEKLPNFGEVLAIDGKAIESYARPRKKENKKPRDGRRDIDADFGTKVYRGVKEDGSVWEKFKTWFGYELHLVVDANYELPVAFKVTPASNSEVKEAHKIVETVEKVQKGIIERCCYFLGDRGYDDEKLITKLWDEYGIKAVIDIRDMWKDGEKTRLLEGTQNIVYDFQGTIYCHCPETGKQREMPYGGFEKGRETLKYRCPADHFGISCKGKEKCPVGKSIRIPMNKNRRLFTPVARSSYKWKELYKKRTAVERVNGRLDFSLGFENHTIRGLDKMELRCGMALMAMLAMALGRIREKQEEKMRSLIAAA